MLDEFAKAEPARTNLKKKEKLVHVQNSTCGRLCLAPFDTTHSRVLSSSLLQHTRPGLSMTHPGVSSLALGLCLCLLYSGYETARASSLTLFNSTDASGSSTAMLSFLLSLASLQLYGRGTEALGGRWTLLLSAGGCCAVFLGLAMALVSFEADVPLEVVSVLFAVRETYVALIGTQVCEAFAVFGCFQRVCRRADWLWLR